MDTSNSSSTMDTSNSSSVIDTANSSSTMDTSNSSSAMDTSNSSNDCKVGLGLQLSEDSLIEELTIYFNKVQISIKKEELAYWKVQSSKILHDIRDLSQNTKVILQYEPKFVRNYFEEGKCTFEEVWDIINTYVNYHKTNIGVIYPGILRSKVLASCTEDNADAELIDSTIGRNLYILYSAIELVDYLGMEPLSLLLAKKLESHTAYEPPETHQEILNPDTPVVYTWDNWCGNRNESKDSKGE